MIKTLSTIFYVIMGFGVTSIIPLGPQPQDSLEFPPMNQEACKTPTGDNGICINLDSCGVLADILKNTRPPAQADVNRLMRYNCGYQGLMPKVCCPTAEAPAAAPGGPLEAVPLFGGELQPASISSGPTLNQSEAGPAPDVTTHRNVGLLNHDICGPFTADKITGGNKTKVLDYPWMALVAYRINNQRTEFRCGGSVINRRYILTAAHCVAELSPGLRLIGVRVGEHDLRTDRDCDRDKDGLEIVCAEQFQDFGIEHYHVHPEFAKEKLQNDIALIRVDADIDFRPNNVKPICLPIGSAAQLSQKRVIVTGWGSTEYGPRSQDLLQVAISLVPNEDCAQTYESRAKIWYKQLCAGGSSGKDSCLGDSGGPLQARGVYNKINLRFVQYGVVSFGTKNCGTEGYPGVYTNVIYYTDWILDNMVA